MCHSNPLCVPPKSQLGQEPLDHREAFDYILSSKMMLPGAKYDLYKTVEKKQ